MNLELLARNNEIYQRWLHEVITYRDLGREYDLTAERIRQVVREMSRGVYIRPNPYLYRAFVERAKQARACPVCGYWILRGATRKTCSSECSALWRRYRRRFRNEEELEQWNLAQAVYVWRWRYHHPVVRVRWALGVIRRHGLDPDDPSVVRYRRGHRPTEARAQAQT